MKKLFFVILILLSGFVQAAPVAPEMQDDGVIAMPDGKHRLHKYQLTFKPNGYTVTTHYVYVVEDLQGNVVAGTTSIDPRIKAGPQTITSMVSPTVEKRTTDGKSSQIVGIKTGTKSKAANTSWVSINCASLATCVDLAKVFDTKKPVDFKQTEATRAEIRFDDLSDRERLAILDHVSKMK